MWRKPTRYVRHLHSCTRGKSCTGLPRKTIQAPRNCSDSIYSGTHKWAFPKSPPVSLLTRPIAQQLRPRLMYRYSTHFLRLFNSPGRDPLSFPYPASYGCAKLWSIILWDRWGSLSVKTCPRVGKGVIRLFSKLSRGWGIGNARSTTLSDSKLTRRKIAFKVAEFKIPKRA
jgi:hypothetical protein